MFYIVNFAMLQYSVYYLVLVQQGPRHNGIFGFPMEKKSSLPTLKASREIKKKLLFYLEIYTMNMKSSCQYAYQTSKPNNSPKKGYSKSTNILWEKFHSYQLLIWKILKDAVQHGPICPKSTSDLRVVIAREWKIISGQKLLLLCHSMPTKLQAVIEASGGHTRWQIGSYFLCNVFELEF